MKKILIILLGLAIFACTSPKQDSEGDQEPTDSTTVSSEDEVVEGAFGEELSAVEITDLEAMKSTLDDAVEFNGKIKVKIEEVCQEKGCWFKTVLPDGSELRVTFKDYGFFVPKNAAGYTAVIEGVALTKEVDVETLKHYAEDAGKSKEEIDQITEAGKEYSFVASGVVIEPN